MFFRRRGRRDPSAAIEAFWQWWAAARPRAEKLIGGAADDGLVAELSARVSAIHPGCSGSSPRAPTRPTCWW
jgi:hypothetical protein